MGYSWNFTLLLRLRFHTASSIQLFCPFLNTGKCVQLLVHDNHICTTDAVDSVQGGKRVGYSFKERREGGEREAGIIMGDGRRWTEASCSHLSFCISIKCDTAKMEVCYLNQTPCARFDRGHNKLVQ